jgi:GNAT superfamily N-acetyltransferase
MATASITATGHTTATAIRRRERARRGDDEQTHGMENLPVETPRVATAADSAAVARLLDTFNREFETPTPGTAVLRTRLERLLAGEDVVALLVGEPAVAVALLTLRPNVWYDGPVALLDELYVRPDLRGRGIGTALLQAACDVVRERGGELFEVNVDEGDTGARRFYERHGFTTTPRNQADRMLYYERTLP